MMSREDFINTLQKTLAGSMGSGSVNENVVYYQDYIDAQIRTGRSEADVIGEMGDPRLLAKSIIEAGKHAGSVSENSYEQVYDDDGKKYEDNQGGHRKIFHMQGWLLALVVILIIIMIVGFVFSVIGAMLPFLIPFVCVVLLVRFFKGRS